LLWYTWSSHKLPPWLSKPWGIQITLYWKSLKFMQVNCLHPSNIHHKATKSFFAWNWVWKSPHVGVLKWAVAGQGSAERGRRWKTTMRKKKKICKAGRGKCWTE
jgi:hypothetical protein